MSATEEKKPKNRRIIRVLDVSGQDGSIISEEAKKDGKSLVFLDPPYYPTAKGKGGKVSVNRMYNGDGFTPADFLRLRRHCDELTRNGVPFILCNSDCEFIRLLFSEYNLVEYEEPRGLKAGKPSSTAKCLVITNYQDPEDFKEGYTRVWEVNMARAQGRVIEGKEIGVESGGASESQKNQS